ncbi:MAG: hypothetical protein JXR76_31620 [Deltaproteobacteria bacterium]|nr:hypothetical protein [Deltaproteobacteria bacterium]
MGLYKDTLSNLPTNHMVIDRTGITAFKETTVGTVDICTTVNVNLKGGNRIVWAIIGRRSKKGCLM